MAAFRRKIGRLVAVRGGAVAPAHPNRTQLQPARITAVGGGTAVDVKVLHATGATYLALPQWSRATPVTLEIEALLAKHKATQHLTAHDHEAGRAGSAPNLGGAQ